MILFDYAPAQGVLPADTVPFAVDFDAVEAAVAVLREIGEEKLRPFLRLPFDNCWFEWSDGKRRFGVWVTDDGDGVIGMRGNVAFTLAPPPFLPKDMKMLAASVKWDDEKKSYGVQEMEGIEHLAPRYPGQTVKDRFAAPDDHLDAFAVIYSVIVLVNSRNLCRVERDDFTKLNVVRAKKGLPPKKAPVKIILLPTTREFMRHRKNPTYLNEQGETMVRCHPALYHTGKGRTVPEIIWRGPYKRGNPELGSKAPQYEVG